MWVLPIQYLLLTFVSWTYLNEKNLHKNREIGNKLKVHYKKKVWGIFLYYNWTELLYLLLVTNSMLQISSFSVIFSIRYCKTINKTCFKWKLFMVTVKQIQLQLQYLLSWEVVYSAYFPAVCNSLLAWLTLLLFIGNWKQCKLAKKLNRNSLNLIFITIMYKIKRFDREWIL